MKIIGLLTAWACEDWIELSIRQALALVDELIIAIGAYDKYFRRIEDQTYDNAKKYLNHEKIKIVSTVNIPNVTRKQNRAETFNQMLKASENIRKDNLLWIFDADEFYSKDSIKEIMDFIKSNNDFDEIKVIDRFFCINFNYYILFCHGRIYRIMSDNPHFTPTQKINPKPKKMVTLLHENPMFHYSMLTGEQLKGILWLSDNFFHKFRWYRKIYKYYDPNNEVHWLKKNQELSGYYGFWISEGEIIEKEGKGLFRYNGKHPDLIENSRLKHISDFRTYMNSKPNYIIYLKVIQQLIKEKRKTSSEKIKEYIINSNFWKLYINKINELLKKKKIIKKITERISLKTSLE